MFEYSFVETANALVDEYAGREPVVADVDDDVIAAVRGLVALRAVADDLLARVTNQAARLGVARRSGMTLRELLCVNGVAPSVASRLIRLGAAREVLPGVARHSRDGSLSAEHLDAVARGITHVAGRTGKQIGSEVIAAVESTLIAVAVVGTPAEVSARARAIAIDKTVSDDAVRDVPVAEDASLNEMGWSQGDDGRLRGDFDVDVLTGERLITALDAASRPRPEPDGSPDARSAARRRADAFTQFLEMAVKTRIPGSFSLPSRSEVIITIPVAGFGGGIERNGAGTAFGVGSAAGNSGVATGGGTENAKANTGAGGDSGVVSVTANAGFDDGTGVESASIIFESGDGSGAGNAWANTGVGVGNGVDNRGTNPGVGGGGGGLGNPRAESGSGLGPNGSSPEMGSADGNADGNDIRDLDRSGTCRIDVTARCSECAKEMGTGRSCPDGCRGTDLIGSQAGSASLGWLGPISEFTARLASCDAKVTGIGFDINGSPLDMSVTARLFTGAVRKAIDARDGGCIKCGGPACWTDCHHITHYADGGLTTVDNGCLLCRSCHTAVHHEGWDIVMGSDRHPWLIPPVSVDPKRRPLPSYNRKTMRLDNPIAA